jgi:hypothetical protein
MELTTSITLDPGTCVCLMSTFEGLYLVNYIRTLEQSKIWGKPPVFVFRCQNWSFARPSSISLARMFA